MICMKTNGTRVLLISIVLQLALLVLSFTVQAKPDYDFSNGKLVSGTDKQIGAVYRYTLVRPLVDAIVTITNLTNGITITTIDGSSGFQEAFQPAIQIPGHSKGYAEFRIDFVVTGTNIPSLQLQVPMTPIDVDGATSPTGNVYEFDQISYTNILNWYLDFSLSGNQLNVNFGGGNGWVTGSNVTAVDYPGVDTVQKADMFTVVESNITSVILRMGGDNQGNSSQPRLRSVYFMKFDYANSFLAQPSILSFRGNENNKKVQLNWTMTNDTKVTNIVVEKATTPNQYEAIGTILTNAEGALQSSYNFIDNSSLSGTAYYRLKMVQPNGSVQYSNILTFRSANETTPTFKLYPTAIQSSVTVNVKAEKTGSAIFQLVDYSGRVLNQQVIGVQQGENNIVVNNLSSISSGNYVAVLRMDNNKLYNQKVIKQ